MWSSLLHNKYNIMEVGSDRTVSLLRSFPRISAFVIRFLDNILATTCTNEISFFLLVSVAQETVLSPALSETP